MDFATNSDLLNEVKVKVDEAAEKIEDFKTTIYSGIDGLGESWSGDSFEAFKEKCHSYEGAFESLITVLKAYSKMIETTENESSQLIVKIEGKLNS